MLELTADGPLITMTPTGASFPGTVDAPLVMLDGLTAWCGDMPERSQLALETEVRCTPVSHR